MYVMYICIYVYYGRRNDRMTDDRILMEETRRAIGKLKGGKAGGVCGVRGEMLKAGGEVTVRWLTAIFNVV